MMKPAYELMFYISLWILAALVTGGITLLVNGE